ncbi:hypothetical protein Hanom_Chr10g00950501 [Helianthus anomalus]
MFCVRMFRTGLCERGKREDAFIELVLAMRWAKHEEGEHMLMWPRFFWYTIHYCGCFRIVIFMGYYSYSYECMYISLLVYHVFCSLK